jgi:hypothetical protein
VAVFEEDFWGALLQPPVSVGVLPALGVLSLAGAFAPDDELIPQPVAVNTGILAGAYVEFTTNLLVSQMTLPVSVYTSSLQALGLQSQRKILITNGTNVFQFSPGVANDYNNLAIASSFTTAKTPLAVRSDGSVVPVTVFGIKITADNLMGTLSVTLNASIGDGIYTSYGPFLVSFTSAMSIIIPCEVYGERFFVTGSNSNLNESFDIKQLSLLFRPRGRV